VRETRPLGSVRGVLSNEHSYRDMMSKGALYRRAERSTGEIKSFWRSGRLGGVFRGGIGFCFYKIG
jgi:hypothetical protein